MQGTDPDEHYTTLHTGASKDDLDLAMATWYGEAEECLADCYACDLVQQAAFRGRASGPKIVKAPLVAFGRGTVVGNQTSSFYRNMACDLYDYTRLVGLAGRTYEQTRAMHNMRRALLRKRTPEKLRPPFWFGWLRLRDYLLRMETPSQDELRGWANRFLDRARFLEKQAGSRRSRDFAKWLCGLNSGDTEVYRWIRDRPPQGVALCDERDVPLPYEQAVSLRAGQFADVWKSDGLDVDLAWPDGPDFDLLPSPDEFKECAKTFSVATAFGTEGLHPRQLALLSDRLVWQLVAIWRVMLRLGQVPDVLAFLIIRLIPKPVGGDRPIGLFVAVARVMHRYFRQTYGTRFVAERLPPIGSGCGASAPSKRCGRDWWRGDSRR